MIDTTNQGDELNPVRKVLKALPRVQAKSDFDSRLKQRLGKTERESKHLRGVALRPVPAYVFSVLAIVLAGVAVYYSLIRTAVAPVEPAQVNRDLVDEKQSQPSVSGQPRSRSETRSTAQPRGLGEGAQEQPATSRLPSPSLPVGESGRDARGPSLLLRQVGGTGLRTQQRPESTEMPFFSIPSGVATTRVLDSIARADSLRRDSLLRFLQEQQRTPQR